MSIIIVDGISSSGKSIALQKIQKELFQERANYSKFIITEHLTERYFEDKSISSNAVKEHILDLLGKVEGFLSIQKNSRFNGNEKVVTTYIERLLLTFYSRKLIGEGFLTEISDLLQDLNCRHYLLTIPDHQFEERLRSTIERRNESWLAYINSLGGITGAIEHFRQQQIDMIEGSNILAKYIDAKIIRVDDIQTDFHKSIR